MISRQLDDAVSERLTQDRCLNRRLKTVAEALTRLFNLSAPATVEYPGYIAIAEKNINDDLSDSDAHWAVGPSQDWQEGVWTGQLTHLDGRDCGEKYAFAVRPASDSPEAIAEAIYVHGIGDLYIGGGCSDVDCSRVRS